MHRGRKKGVAIQSGCHLFGCYADSKWVGVANNDKT